MSLFLRCLTAASLLLVMAQGFEATCEENPTRSKAMDSGSTLTAKALKKKLGKMGYRPSKYKLEPFDLSLHEGPEGAFEGVATYMLWPRKRAKRLDSNQRAWRPVLVVGDEVMLGPGTGLLRAILNRIGYFENPATFQEGLVLQLHSFCLDFNEGYELREKGLGIEGDTLTITGMAYRGVGEKSDDGPFTTTVTKGQEPIFKVR